MTDDFATLYAYNRWADAKVLEACRALSPERYAAEPAPGWSPVRSTLYHLAIVTEGWLRGLTGETVGMPPPESEFPAVDDVARLLESAYRTVDALLPSLTPERLAEPMTLRGGGRVAVAPPWVVLRHVVNHSTYHRGQVASKLARIGLEPPGTDLIHWAFETGLVRPA